jgi:hypothetical protein
MSILGLSILDTESVTVGAGFWIRALARVVDTVYGYALGAVAGVQGVIILAILVWCTPKSKTVAEKVRATD